VDTAGGTHQIECQLCLAHVFGCMSSHDEQNLAAGQMTAARMFTFSIQFCWRQFGQGGL